MFDAVLQAHFAVFFTGAVHRFGQTVGENHEQIARLNVYSHGHIFCPGIDSERHAAFTQANDLSRGSAQKRRVVAGVYVTELPRSRLVLRDESSSEAQSGEAVRAGIAIDVMSQFVEAAV